ncbi:MAG: Crp/Fnr family transcriptional regulator [Beijerinckiaceae bacterium]
MNFFAQTDWFLYLGYAAVVSSIVTSYMKTMIPLRIVSMICNSLFVIYAFAAHVYPTLFLNLILLPMNGWRLWEMIQLTRKVRAAASGDRSFDWLKPFMARKRFKAGDVLFRKGEEADVLYFTVSGRFRLRESGLDIQPGQVVGELALVAADKRRTQTLECVEDGEAMVATYAQVKQIYYQNPEFGFHFLELTSARLFQNIARLEAELESCKARAA